MRNKITTLLMISALAVAFAAQAVASGESHPQLVCTAPPEVVQGPY